MADNNENFRMTKSETEHFIEQLKKPQYPINQVSDKKQLLLHDVVGSEPNGWTQEKVQKAFSELGFDFPENEEQLRAFDEKFKNYPYKLNGAMIDPHKIMKECK